MISVQLLNQSERAVLLCLHADYLCLETTTVETNSLLIETKFWFDRKASFSNQH